MTRVYLVRHGTHALVGKIMAGRMPGVSLSEEGRKQAEALARHFDHLGGATAILSSPLERCRETAAPIAERLGMAVEVSPDLDEIDCGDWTGLSFEDLARDTRWQAWNSERGRTVVPGGESVRAVQARAMALIERLAAQDSSVTLLVTHSDVIKVIILSLLGGSLDWHDRLEIEPASISTLDLWPGGGKIVRSNETVPV